MRQKLLNKVWLQVSLLVAVMSFAFAGTAMATDYAVVKELDMTTKTVGCSAYNTSTTYADWVIVNGANNNKGWAYFKMGGKNSTISDYNPCYIYSTSAASDAVDKITVHLPAGSLSKNGMSVNSWGVYVYSDAAMTTQVDYVAGGTITNSEGSFDFTPSTGVTWTSGCYYKVSWDLANTSTTNGIVCVDKITLYKEGSAAPVQLGAPELTATANNGSVTLEWEDINHASSYTIQYADNAQFTGAITVTDATSPKEITGLTNGTTYYFKAMAVGDGTSYLSSEYGNAASATPVNTSTITITQDELIAFTNSYKWYDWTIGGISGKAYAYKNSGMQFNSGKDAYWIYNTSAIPGTITSVKMVKASGTDRSWTLKAGTSEISSTDGGTAIGNPQTVGTSGATWDVTGSYNYFLLYVSGGSTVISSIEITYIPSTDPIIIAEDPAELACDVTSGEFSYSITNPTSATLNATSNSDWITNVSVDGINSKVTFSTSSNTGAQRQGTITLSYTGATDKVINITQAAYVAPFEPSTWTLANSITSGKHYIIVNSDVIKAMGGQNTNNRYAVDVEIENDVVTVNSSDVVEFNIFGPDAEGLYTIYDGNANGYLYAASSGSNHLKTQETNNDNGRWEITFGENNIASIVATKSNNRNTMQYNGDNNNNLFSCYGSASQTAIKLFEKNNDTPVTTKASVTLNGSGYATFSSTSALDFLDYENANFSAWQISSVSGTAITFSQIDKHVKAGTGILLKGTANSTIDLNILPVGGATLTDNKLVGITTATAVNDNEYYGLSGNEFKKVNAGTVPAGKALLPASVVNNVSGNARLSFVFEGDDATTGISTMHNSEFIMHNEVYNLNGQRVNDMKKGGLYIMNGKKVIVK